MELGGLKLEIFASDLDHSIINGKMEGNQFIHTKKVLSLIFPKWDYKGKRNTSHPLNRTNMFIQIRI